MEQLVHERLALAARDDPPSRARVGQATEAGLRPGKQEADRICASR